MKPNELFESGDYVVETAGLTRDFGVRTILRGVNWSVPRGSAVGLLGRNGSGKTTLLHVVLGLLAPTSGRVTTLGAPSMQLDDDRLARIGFVDQKARLLDWLSVEQHLHYVAMMQPHHDKALQARVMEELELDAHRATRVGALSEGLRQRLAIVCAVSHRPALLVLDEPVAAQDPIARARVLELVLERVTDDGTTVIISSHVLRDVESVVDRITCLDAGRIVCDDDLDSLKERHALEQGQPLDLERLFPLITSGAAVAARGVTP